jgi:hypothetical protein
MDRQTRRIIAKSWGYLIIAFLIAGTWYSLIGPAVIAVGSGLSFLYCLFQAPVFCCAETRGHQFCRNNANGLLLGCWVRQHKWQKMQMVVSRQSWAQLGRRTFAGIGGCAAALSAIGTLVSACAAVIAILIA